MNADEYQKQIEEQELFEAEQKSKLIEDCNDAVEAMISDNPWWFEINQDKAYIEEMEK